MLRGMTTVNYWAADVPAAVRWYTDLLGAEPYFARPDSGDPVYVEWRVGDYQHGIIDTRFRPQSPDADSDAGTATRGVVVYWHVDDVEAAVPLVTESGATVLESAQDRGEGFITATVIDPFGNVLGLMYNPHYLAVLNSHSQA